TDLYLNPFTDSISFHCRIPQWVSSYQSSTSNQIPPLESQSSLDHKPQQSIFDSDSGSPPKQQPSNHPSLPFISSSNGAHAFFFLSQLSSLIPRRFDKRRRYSRCRTPL
ncbi:hypothetical protein LINPERPRIM_LOCUS37448, partial [Linum perenne]